MSDPMPSWWPYAKVVAATVGALILATLTALATDGIPSDADGWIALAVKVLGPALGAAGFGWAKTETHP